MMPKLTLSAVCAVLVAWMAGAAQAGPFPGRRTYELWIKCVPAKLAGTPGDQYTCSKFVVKTGDSLGTAIPIGQYLGR